MPDFELSIGLFGDTQIAGKLLDASERCQDASPWFRMMAGWLEGEVEDQFVTEGGHWSGGWPSLSPMYFIRKAADGYGDQPIMQRTGDLMRSLTTGGAGSVRHITARQMVFGSQLKYGPPHQRGVPSRNLPMRKMLDLTRRSDTRRVVRSLGLFITRGHLTEPTDMFGGTGGGGGWSA